MLHVVLGPLNPDREGQFLSGKPPDDSAGLIALASQTGGDPNYLGSVGSVSFLRDREEGRGGVGEEERWMGGEEEMWSRV